MTLFITNYSVWRLRKRYIALFGAVFALSLIISPFLFRGAFSSAPATLFSDGFESGNFSVWTVADTHWDVIRSGVAAREGGGEYGARVTGDTGSDDDILSVRVPTSGYQNISVSYWRKVYKPLEEEDGFYAEWSSDGTTTTVLEDVTNTSSGSWAQKTFSLPEGAANNPGFRFQFRARMNAATTDAVNIDDVLVTGELIPPPIAPIWYAATAASSRKIHLNWGWMPIENETGFELERAVITTPGSCDPASYDPVALFPQSPLPQDVTATSNMDVAIAYGASILTVYNIPPQNVTPNTLYCYRVRAFNDAGASAWAVREVNRQTPDERPMIPTELVMLSLSSSEVRLSWTDDQDLGYKEETSFTLYRCVAESETCNPYDDGEEIATIPVTLGDNTSGPATVEYADGNIEPDRTYAYCVRAVNAAGASACSDAVNVTTPSQEESAPETGTLTVCKVIIDENGSVTGGSDGPEAEFDITVDAEGIGAVGFETPLELNSELPGETGIVAECRTYELGLGTYYYIEEEIDDAEDWSEPLYDDDDSSEGFSLEGFEEFDNSGDADGSIALTAERPDRYLAVLNRHKTLRAEEPTPSPEPSENPPSPSPEPSSAPASTPPLQSGGGSAPILLFTKTAEPDVVYPGGQITYAVKIFNTGNAPANNAVVADALPAGFTFADNGAGLRTFPPIPSVDPGETEILRYAVNVATTVTPGAHENYATLKTSFSGLMQYVFVAVNVEGRVLGESTASTSVEPSLTLPILSPTSSEQQNRGSSTPQPSPSASGGVGTEGRVLGESRYFFSYNLRYGMRNDAVEELQKRLTQEGFYSGPITGFFGRLTRAAVRQYQAAHGISATGFVGKLTRAKLNG